MESAESVDRILDHKYHVIEGKNVRHSVCHGNSMRSPAQVSGFLSL